MKAKWIAFGSILLIACSISCAEVSIEAGGSMGSQGQNRMQNLFEKTKTICIGRFLVDVPIAAQVIYGPAELPYPIKRMVGRGRYFDELLKERREGILSAAHKYIGGGSQNGALLGRVLDGRVPSQKILVGLSSSSDSNYVLESYQRIGDDIYVQEVVPYGDGYAVELDELKAISPLLDLRHEEQIPSEHGICFDGAFLKEPITPIYEYVTLGVRLTDFKDVHFSIELTKKDVLVASDALEPRVRRAEVEARKVGLGQWYDKVKILRKGQRNIGSWKGYEHLAWKPSLGDAPESHVFAYVSQGVPTDPLQPVLDIALDTGVKGNESNGVKPSLTDEEAIFVWDRLTGSIRQRPVTQEGL